jgi:Fe2+ or Zn2+ uptake regulation protein
VSEPDADAQVAEAVLAYLVEHPDAMDTAGGVAEWWVMRQRVRGDVETVSRVLRALVERGVLEEIGEGAQRRYRIKR